MVRPDGQELMLEGNKYYSVRQTDNTKTLYLRWTPRTPEAASGKKHLTKELQLMLILAALYPQSNDHIRSLLRDRRILVRSSVGGPASQLQEALRVELAG